MYLGKTKIYSTSRWCENGVQLRYLQTWGADPGKVRTQPAASRHWQRRGSDMTDAKALGRDASCNLLVSVCLLLSPTCDSFWLSYHNYVQHCKASASVYLFWAQWFLRNTEGSADILGTITPHLTNRVIDATPTLHTFSKPCKDPRRKDLMPFLKQRPKQNWGVRSSRLPSVLSSSSSYNRAFKGLENKHLSFLDLPDAILQDTASHTGTLLNNQGTPLLSSAEGWGHPRRTTDQVDFP